MVHLGERMTHQLAGRKNQGHRNEGTTLASIWPEIEKGLKQVFFDKTSMTKKEYMHSYTYPLIFPCCHGNIYPSG